MKSLRFDTYRLGSFVSRRRLLGALGGAGMASVVGGGRHAIAQQVEATPDARGTPVADDADSSAMTVVEGEAPAVGRPKRGGNIRIVRPGVSLANFNPSAFAQDQQIPLSYLEPLLRPDPQTMQPRPWLATRWEWREDGRVLDLTLRDGVVWHDGGAVTASDAAFSFEVYRADADSAVAGLFALVEEIAAVSDTVLRVSFSGRDASWLFNAATLPIFSRRQYETFWTDQRPGQRSLSGFDWKQSLPVGSGPWQVGEWDERSVQFRRFNRYWRSPAWLDTLEVAVEPGERDRLANWEDGAADVVWPVDIRLVKSVRDLSGTLYLTPGASVMFAAFNFANPVQPNETVWADPRVRQAASLAIDRERYAEEIFGGFLRWDAVGTIAQPWAHDAELTTPRYNPQAAAALLGEAGWIDYTGDGQRVDVQGNPLSLVAIVREDSRPELVAVLARVARDLAAVGMTLDVEALSGDDFDERWITRRDYDLIAYAYGVLPGFTDFDLYGSAWDIRTNPVGWNPGGYANAEADAAIADYLAALSITRQREALLRLQRAVNDDLFGLWLGFPDDAVLIADGVEGFAPDINWQTARTAALWRSDR